MFKIYNPTMLLLLLIILIICTLFVLFYNSLISKHLKVEEAWSGIDVQLKRRHVLVPNLVAVVKGYAEHEKNLLKEVTERRNISTEIDASSLSQKALAEGQLAASLGRLIAIAEDYPDLKANENFLNLQNDLVEIEDTLQHARRYYNGTVRNYEILRQSFPTNIVASMFSFLAKEYFELEDVLLESANVKIEI